MAPKPDTARKTLGQDFVHETWERSYRTIDNERFYERAFDRVVEMADAPPGATWIDLGCGRAFNAIRLASRGYRVRAVDFSPAVLEDARHNVRSARLQDRISVEPQDICALTLDSGSADYMLAWGVLMHIPDIERAMAEISRVLRPGGTLVVSELNMYSLEHCLVRLRDLFQGRTWRRTRTARGIETWLATPAGPMFHRRVDIGWLTRGFSRHDLRLQVRHAGQLTELYTHTADRSRLLTKAIHAVNRIWFSFVRTGRFAEGNILVFRKAS